MKAIIKFFILFFVTTNIFADPQTLYAGLGYEKAFYKGGEIEDISYLPGQRVKDSSDMLSLYVGYHINNFFSVEAGYAEFGSASELYTLDPDIVFITLPNDREDIDFNRISLNTTLNYPLSDKLSVFGLLGYSILNVDHKLSGGDNPVNSSSNEDGILYGAGGRYQFNDKYSTRLQWTRTDTGGVKLDAILISLEINLHTF
jgi:opacity protein-like surface antigen